MIDNDYQDFSAGIGDGLPVRRAGRKPKRGHIRGLARATLVGGETIVAHPPSACEGRVCCVHNPSGHHMAAWPQHWRVDRGLMERICPHRIGHPDPDDVASRRERGLPADEVHGCCGCCSGVPISDNEDR